MIDLQVTHDARWPGVVNRPLHALNLCSAVDGFGGQQVYGVCWYVDIGFVTSIQMVKGS